MKRKRWNAGKTRKRPLGAVSQRGVGANGPAAQRSVCKRRGGKRGKKKKRKKKSRTGYQRTTANRSENH